ncbi:MAG: prenyltransferase/squalene oxidase repeat-containing protein [Symbiobacteriia bacterium]
MRFLVARQRPEGLWEETAQAGAAVPPWVRPGDPQATLYLTANCGFWLALNGQRDGAERAAAYLRHYLLPTGVLPSFPHTHWLAAGLFWRLGDAERAERLMFAFRDQLGELPASNLAWLMTSLLIAGVSPDHFLLQAARQYLENQQQEAGHWASEDGPDWDLHSTLEAVRALRLCGETEQRN